MSTTYCPTVAASPTRALSSRCTPKGKEPGLRVIHCNLCNGFIRSEEVPRVKEKDSVP